MRQAHTQNTPKGGRNDRQCGDGCVMTRSFTDEEKSPQSERSSGLELSDSFVTRDMSTADI